MYISTYNYYIWKTLDPSGNPVYVIRFWNNNFISNSTYPVLDLGTRSFVEAHKRAKSLGYEIYRGKIKLIPGTYHVWLRRTGDDIGVEVGNWSEKFINMDFYPIFNLKTNKFNEACKKAKKLGFNLIGR